MFLIPNWETFTLEFLFPYLNGIDSVMVLSPWLDEFLVHLSFLVFFLANHELISGQCTPLGSFPLHKVSLSCLRFLKNLLGCGCLTLIVILIKMSYVGLRLGSLVGLVVGLVDVFLELTIDL